MTMQRTEVLPGLTTPECEDYYGLMQQLATVQVRQVLNPGFKPYCDVLKEIIPQIMRMKSMSYDNLHTLMDGLDKLKEVPKMTPFAVEITVKNAAKHAGVSALVMGGMVDAAVFAYQTFKDFNNQDLTLEEFRRQLARNTASAVGSTALGWLQN